MPALARPDPPLSDGVIALRGLEPRDVPVLVESCQDPEIPRWTLVPSPYDADDARAYLQRVHDGLAAGTRMSLAITDARSGAELRAQQDNHASQAVAAGAAFARVEAPLVRRPECDHLPDVFFARLRGG